MFLILAAASTGEAATRGQHAMPDLIKVHRQVQPATVVARLAPAAHTAAGAYSLNPHLPSSLILPS